MSEDNRRELARFLRIRRERIRPAEVGLPAGPRRRAPGLRREEVAVLAGLSPTWYTYLEQGRDIHPSSEVLDSLARVLSLTEDERRYMHLLAYGTVRQRELAGELSAEDIVRLLVKTTENSPYPTYGANVYCDLVAWNKATVSYYTDFALLPTERPNMLRWLLEAPDARQRLPDWHNDVRDVVARWRAMVVSRHGDTRLNELVREFRLLSPEFGTWWDQHEVREHRTRMRVLRHPVHGEVTMRLIVVSAPEFAPCIVVFHLPLNDAA